MDIKIKEKRILTTTMKAGGGYNDALSIVMEVTDNPNNLISIYDGECVEDEETCVFQKVSVDGLIAILIKLKSVKDNN